VTEQQVADAHKALNVPEPFTNTKNPGARIPEEQVISAGNNSYDWKIGNRNARVSSGFMEKSGHSSKEKLGSTAYLDSQNPDPNKPALRYPTGIRGKDYNIGIDYVLDGDKKVTPWYSGVVTKAGRDGGYGNSVTVKTGQNYEYNGKRYPIYNTYSHLEYISKGIKRNSKVDTDTYIGKMGGTGATGRNTDLPVHGFPELC
jgi:murein DD-endopeptidase MepM/ murein hydrolase activator NlpD